MNKLVFSIAIFLFLATQKNEAAVLDSLRIEKIEGKNYVIHKVDKGQTLFGTLRRYGSNLSEYKATNPNEDLGIQIGQILRIPYSRPIKNSVSKITEKSPAKAKAIIVSTEPNGAIATVQEVEKIAAKKFKVEPGMTLFAVAKRNNTTVAEIKRLNNLKSDIIVAGQMLIVKEEIIKNVKPKLKAETKAKEVIVKVNDVPAPVIVKEKEIILPEKEKIVIEPKKEIPKVVEKPNVIDKKVSVIEIKPESVFIKPPITEILQTNENIESANERVVKVEEGIAELIEVESKSGKYLALHKTAPLGTLVQVKNITNSATVWVKVIGRLPELDQNENVIIKLSPKAMDRISPIDKRFRAKINYSL